MVLHTEKAGLRRNQSGSAMIMVLFVVTFLSLLGVLSLSAAAFNMRIQRMNRSSEQNFYKLEAAMDEIRIQMGIVSESHLKDSYSLVLEHLYLDELITNQQANHLFGEESVNRLLTAFGLNEWQSGLVLEEGGIVITEPSLCQSAADRLKSFSATYGEVHLRASVESIQLESGISGDGTEDSTWNTLLFKGFCLTYVEPETGALSSLTVDLRIRLPYIQFINEGDAALGYVLIANQQIQIDGTAGNLASNSELGSRYDVRLQGNVYGSSIQIDGAGVSADSPLFTSKGTLSVENGGYLELGISPASESQARLNRVYAQDLELHNGSRLTAEEANFYIRDDMILDGDWNYVQMAGRYYGYGNGNTKDGQTGNPENSSAILINDKYSTLDLRRLDTLMLAGRAYLRFQSAGLPYVYPLAESLAIRSTQGLYLVQAAETSVDYGDGPVPAESNPFVLPEQVDSASVAASPSEAHVLLLAEQGEFYLYHDFQSDQERAEYFENYLTENGTDFDAFLEEAGMAAAEGAEEGRSGRVLLNEGGQILSAGAVYQVSGAAGEGTGHLFSLLTMGRGSADRAMNRLSSHLEHTFENLKQNLTESERINSAGTETGAERLLPVGSYVNLQKIERELAESPCYIISESGEVGGMLISGDDLTVDLENAEAEIRDSYGRVYELAGGLIVSSGNITIQNRGGSNAEQAAFEGIVIAGGSIHISGNVSLSANPYSYQELLIHEEAAPYFYLYGEESTISGNSSGFVTMENWLKSGRRVGGSGE